MEPTNLQEPETTKLLYNTQRKSLKLPEYGRNVQKMVEYLRTIEDRQKRNEQAQAVIKVMATINPQVHLQENFEQKLWDHLFIIADYDLDVDSPYPMPAKEKYNTKPLPIPLDKSQVKASHYGRNVQIFIEKLVTMEPGPDFEQALHQLAFFMRAEYLSFNKDGYTEESLFADIVELSGGRLQIPEGFHIHREHRQNYSQQNGNQPHNNKYNNHFRNRGK